MFDFQTYDATPQKEKPTGATTIEQLGTHYFITPDQVIVACANAMLGGAVAIDQLLQIIAEFFQADSAFIFERDYEKRKTTNTHAFYDRDHSYLYPQGRANVFSFDPDSSWHQRVSESPYLYLESDEFISQGFPYVGSYLVDHYTKNVLVSVLKEEGTDIGVVGLSNIKNNFQHFHLFSIIKSFCSSGLNIKRQQQERDRILEQLEERNRHAQAIIDCVTTLSQGQAEEVALSHLLEVLGGYFQGRRVHLLRSGQEGQEGLEDYPQHSQAQQAVPWVAGLCQDSLEVIGHWFQLFGQENFLWVSSLSQDLEPTQSHTKEYQALHQDQVHSFLATQLGQSKTPQGFLLVESPKANHQDSELLRTVTFFVEGHLNKLDLMKKLEYAEKYDKKAGELNRDAFRTQVQALQQAEIQSLGILFGLAEGLKQANDLLGHEMGDVLLAWCGKFLQDQVQGPLFRVGGDEFICLLPDLPQEDFQDLVQELRDNLAQKGRTNLTLTPYWTQDTEDICAQITQADVEIYHKRQEAHQDYLADQGLEAFTQSLLSLKEELAEG